MTNLTTIASTVTAAFLGSFVEVVEAFTVVLAVGLSRSWRSAFIGTGLALLALVALVALFGPLLSLVPLHLLQFVAGVLLILFGLRWLRKAILRATGFIALHDEDKTFIEETELLKRQAADRRANYLAGLTAFKAVLLEGAEVVFIVIAVGAGRGLTVYAGLGAAAAFVLVLAIGLILHRPLAKVPEKHTQVCRRPDADKFRPLLDWRGAWRGMARCRSVSHWPSRHTLGLRPRHDALATHCIFGRKDCSMTALRSAYSEFIGLFIDDGSLALFAMILIALVTAAVKIFDLPSLQGAVLLVTGCILILADSIRRAAKRRN